MNRLVSAACGGGIILVAVKQPWLTAISYGAIGEMRGTGEWIHSVGQIDQVHGWAMQVPMVLAGLLIIVGAMTGRAEASVNRIMGGSVIAAATALFAILAKMKVSGIPVQVQAQAVVHAAMAPKAAIALAFLAFLSACMAAISEETATDEQVQLAERQRKQQKLAESQRADAELRNLMNEPVQVLAGGAAGRPEAIPVWHWKLDPEVVDSPITWGGPDGYGMSLALQAGGGIIGEFLAPDLAIAQRPGITSDPSFAAWTDVVEGAIEDIEDRYRFLEHIRYDKWFTDFATRAGIATTEMYEERWQAAGSEGEMTGTRTVCTTMLPVLRDVRISRDGLVLVYQRRVGDSAERWNETLTTLRAAFANVGVDTARLTIADDTDGDIVLSFNDTLDGDAEHVVVAPVTATLQASNLTFQ
jgi:hypothetical protein